MRINQMGVPMNSELGVGTAEEFTDADDLKELHGALLSTQSVEQFLHEMAVLASMIQGSGVAGYRL